MKKVLSQSILVLATAALIFTTGCKKEEEAPADDTASQTTSASDEAIMQAESDQANEDANTAINGFSNISGRFSGPPSICGATIDTTDKSNGIIYINYDGTTPCVNGTRKRAGQIKLEVMPGTKWKDIGAVLKITFNNYKVTRISDGKSLVMNGTKSIINVSGGLVGIDPVVVHKAKALDLSLTFDNGTVRKWSVSRKITYTASGSTRSVKIEGDTTVNGITNVVIWGTNRRGEAFYTNISTPLEANNLCGWHKPVAGVKTHKGIARELSIMLGLDASGNAVSSGCATHYKIKWTNIKGQSKEALISY